MKCLRFATAKYYCIEILVLLGSSRGEFCEINEELMFKCVQCKNLSQDNTHKVSQCMVLCSGHQCFFVIKRNIYERFVYE